MFSSEERTPQAQCKVGNPIPVFYTIWLILGPIQANAPDSTIVIMHFVHFNLCRSYYSQPTLTDHDLLSTAIRSTKDDISNRTPAPNTHDIHYPLYSFSTTQPFHSARLQTITTASHWTPSWRVSILTSLLTVTNMYIRRNQTNSSMQHQRHGVSFCLRFQRSERPNSRPRVHPKIQFHSGLDFWIEHRRRGYQVCMGMRIWNYHDGKGFFRIEKVDAIFCVKRSQSTNLQMPKQSRRKSHVVPAEFEASNGKVHWISTVSFSGIDTIQEESVPSARLYD